MLQNGVARLLVIAHIVGGRLTQNRRGIRFRRASLGAKFTRQRLGQPDSQCLCHTTIVTQAGNLPSRLFFSPQIPHVPLDAVGRLDELLVAGGKACPAEARAVRAKGGSRNHGHFLRLQQADGEIPFTQAGL